MGWTIPTNINSKHIAVIGAGPLGRNIGLIWAGQGSTVCLFDVDPGVAQDSVTWIQEELSSRPGFDDGRSGRVVVATDVESSVQGAWQVIECLPEQVKSKSEMLGQLDRLCEASTIIATVSSSSEISALVVHVSESGRKRTLNTTYSFHQESSSLEVQSCGATEPALMEYMSTVLHDLGSSAAVNKKVISDYGHISSSKSAKQLMSLRQKLLGAWELVKYSGWTAEIPSDIIFPMTEGVKGIIMYTPDGYMSAQLHIPGQKPFRSDDLNGGTKDELAEVGKNYLAYTGPFHLDERDGVPILQHHMTNCSFPNWVGNTQRRLVSINMVGNNRILTLAPEGEVTVMGEKRILELVWRRLPDNIASY